MSWTDALRLASYAGVPFWWRAARVEGGRNLVVQQIPFSPPRLEDTGPLPDKFRITAFFIGSFFLLERAAFIAALAAASGPATLILPTLGPMRVRPGSYQYEDSNQVGNYSAVEVEFVIDHGVLSPLSASDTASQLLSAISDAQSAIIGAYTAMVAPLAIAGSLLGYAANMLGGITDIFGSLPPSVAGGVPTGFAAAPSDPVATSTAITGALLAASNNAVAVLAPPALPTPTAISGTLPPVPAPADASQGIAALALNPPALVPAPAAPVGAAPLRQATSVLLQAAAFLALVNFSAQTTLASAQAAAALRAQIVAALAAVTAAAFDAGQPDLLRVLAALGAQAITDMVARAQGLPSLTPYQFGAALPDVVVAQALYQDATQAGALAALNGAHHPLFMPPAGIWLQPA